MRKRNGASAAYAVPCAKKIGIVKPAASAGPYKAHPYLEEQTYLDILAALQNMALVMERTPSAFVGNDEEALRMQFLIPLNGMFEGDATGETFNHDGKTDILLRKDGKNVFIAECKFWSGPKKFHETIDQLLNYLTWRDTKTAIIVFVRDVAISTVLQKIPELLKTHPNFTSMQAGARSDEFRATFKSARDNALSLILTVQVYDVPK